MLAAINYSGHAGHALADGIDPDPSSICTVVITRF
jgi:hypothetical protein